MFHGGIKARASDGESVAMWTQEGLSRMSANSKLPSKCPFKIETTRQPNRNYVKRTWSWSGLPAGS